MLSAVVAHSNNRIIASVVVIVIIAESRCYIMARKKSPFSYATPANFSIFKHSSVHKKFLIFTRTPDRNLRLMLINKEYLQHYYYCRNRARSTQLKEGKKN